MRCKLAAAPLERKISILILLSFFQISCLIQNNSLLPELLILREFGKKAIVTSTTTPTTTVAPTIVMSTPDRDTNEFQTIASFTISLNSAPSDEIKICIKSTDISNGGIIVVGNDVNAADGTCASSRPYISFSSSNWAIKTIKVKGSRGTVGIAGDTKFSIQFNAMSSDTILSNIKIADVPLKNLDIDGSASFFVLTQLSGLSSGTLSLKLNNTQSLSLSLNGNDTFHAPLSNGNIYSISIQSQPIGYNCAFISLPFGTISSNHVTIQIKCVSGYLFNGTLLSTSNPPTLNQSFAGLVTLAGSFPATAANGNVDGAGTVARFDNPIAITSDGTNIYVADLSNNAIRKIAIGTNTVSTLATINSLPHGVATDGVNVYVAAYGSHTIFKVEIATGTVTTLAGSAPAGDVVGDGASAKFSDPTYLTTDGVNLFVVDRGNGKVKQIVLSTGIVSTVVSALNSPNGIATDGVNLYIAETGSHQIIKYAISSGMQFIVAGTTGVSGNVDNATGLLAKFNNPFGLTMDGSYLYILEGTGRNLKKMLLASPNSVTTILAQNDGYSDGAIGSAQFCVVGSCDTSITFDGNFLYFADRFNHSIRKLYY